MDHRIRSAIERIDRRFERRWTVAQMAAGVNLSVSRFSHLFRTQVGIPPSRYLKRVRMAAARRLLETSFLSVKEVMARVGFNDVSHFVRDFRHHYGVPPGQVRRDAGPGRGEVAAETANKQPDRPTEEGLTAPYASYVRVMRAGGRVRATRRCRDRRNGRPLLEQTSFQGAYP